jgi:hypothetical protein
MGETECIKPMPLNTLYEDVADSSQLMSSYEYFSPRRSVMDDGFYILLGPEVLFFNSCLLPPDVDAEEDSTTKSHISQPNTVYCTVTND